MFHRFLNRQVMMIFVKKIRKIVFLKQLLRIITRKERKKLNKVNRYRII